jgi:hypothetical protein
MRYFYDTEFLDDGNTINFISIGIIREDGLEYYAVNADADWSRIHKHDWLMANVVNQLPPKSGWKPKTQIADEVENFLLSAPKPQLWGWFSAYDHVVLAQLFGTMLDLPRGIPMFTNDLRSLIDRLGVKTIPPQGAGMHDALEDARLLKIRYEYVIALTEDNSAAPESAIKDTSKKPSAHTSTDAPARTLPLRTKPSAFLSQHGLVGEGAPMNDHGYRIGRLNSTSGSGRARCACGELSSIFDSAAKRKAWHREHKDSIRAMKEQQQ